MRMSSPTLANQLAAELGEAARGARERCGDLIAQTTAYGLLLEGWGVDSALDPHLADPEAVSRIRPILDRTDLDAIALYYHSEGKDPAIYFYERFLRAYDPRVARTHGVHYSPPQVVAYIVGAVESVLVDKFGEMLGQAVVLDPCCGVGTFLRQIETTARVPPTMVGMELMEAPHAIAKRLLAKCDVRCANFLDDGELDIPGRTLVILGNPPYSGHSSNAGKVSNLLADYKTGLEERNSKWLQDDYVKFIRMAQYHVERAGRGVVAFITNHSYLFNPTFRVMRSYLARTFDEVYVLDLHGNAKKANLSLKADVDENVFSIQMGVAISLFVKTSSAPGCTVKYAELRGSRRSKLAMLARTNFRETPWREVSFVAPFLLFTPTSDSHASEYVRFTPINELFERSSVGFVTSRDRFAVDFDRDALLARIDDLRNPALSLETIREKYPVGDLDVETARQALLRDMFWEDRAVEVMYRPFDRRWAYLSSAIMERPRLPFMENLLHDNVALAVGRAGHATGSDTWDVAFCTDVPADLNLFRRGGAMLFPRYAWEGGAHRSNVRWNSRDADKLFNYMYAILYSLVYRRRYADFLKTDYPRIPTVVDDEVFDRLAELGRRLIDVHLMRGHGPLASDAQTATSMRIGGYELPRKYIEDRRGRTLLKSECQYIDSISTAITGTHAIQAQIDEVVKDALGAS
ncbi:MAG: hypothetical protein A2Z18_02500 [Armatimonadetes bacterium RBG_16_58_9]|nr:MAG: hypothetical protein A2Z18_02500 [Armatimonadetes bacterium RBG_16_58_9]